MYFTPFCHFYSCSDNLQRPRMTELAFARVRTFVRLGEAVPMVFFSSAGDFILPVNCGRSTTAVRAASGTAGKMNSPEAEPRHAGRHAAGLSLAVSRTTGTLL